MLKKLTTRVLLVSILGPRGSVMRGSRVQNGQQLQEQMKSSDGSGPASTMAGPVLVMRRRSRG